MSILFKGRSLGFTSLTIFQIYAILLGFLNISNSRYMKIRVSLISCLCLALIAGFLLIKNKAEAAVAPQMQSVSVSLAVNAIIYSYVENGQLIVQTNSREPVCVLENDILRAETAWIGHDAKITLIGGNSYTTLSCI